MVGLRTRIIQATWPPEREYRFPIRSFRAQRWGANVISSTTSFAPTRGAQHVTTLQGVLAYSFSRPPIQTFSLREFSHRGSSAGASGRFSERPFERNRVSNSVWRTPTVFFDEACSAHLLGANEVQPTTSFAPRRGAQNVMTNLVKHHPFSSSLHPLIRSPHLSFPNPCRYSYSA